MKNIPVQIRACLKFITLFVLIDSSFAFAEDTYYRMVRALETHELGISSTSGLTFSPRANTFLIAAAPDVLNITLLTILDNLAGSIKLARSIPDPINMAFDNKANRLLFFDAGANELIEVKMSTDDRQGLSPETIARFRIPQLDLKNAKGMAFDPDTGALFFLDANGPRIIRITPDLRGRFDGSSGEQDGRISTIILNSLRGAKLQGIAFNSYDGHLYIMDPAGQKLYELTQQGDVVTTRDLSSLDFADTRGMVFAPSGDRTDDPAIQNLYIVDRGLNAGQGDIVELSLVKPKQINLSVFTEEAVVIQTIHTSQWSPPSPDPAGVAYISSSNKLLISDSEVDEMAIYTGANVYESALSGNLLNTYTTLAFSIEPTGVAYNPDNQHLYFTSDLGSKRMFELDPGPDELYWTPDDIITSFLTSAFLSNDPKGITYNTDNGHLFIADGANAEIYDVDPGNNGLFDGVPPAGDDIVTNFDTAVLGLLAPEGVEFNTDNGNLYILSSSSDLVVETTTAGAMVGSIDLSILNANNLSGLAYAPSSNNPFERSLYIVARGVDNSSDPNENDGIMYEISLGSFAPYLSINDVVVQEGNTGTMNAVFTVTLSNISQETVTVEYSPEDGTATISDNDYIAVSGQLTFLPGETSQPVTVLVNGDVMDEPSETFFVTLSNAVNAPIGDDEGGGTITDDDGATPITVSFQDGIDGYSGTRDTKFVSNAPGTNYGSATRLDVDGFPDASAMLYWDLTDISPGNTIQSVEIIVNVTNTSGNNYELYELKRPWVESEANWNEYATSQDWQTAGASGSGDRGFTAIGGISALSPGLITISLNTTGIAMVQSWIDDPSSNHGIIVQDYYGSSDGLAFTSRDTSFVAKRPKITVTYAPEIYSLVVNAKVYLEGPWNNGAMHTNLKDSDLLPLDQPFNTTPWNYSGAETVGAIPAGVVDWVLVKLRTSPDVSHEVAGRAAFVKNDGSIVDLDGSSPVSFSGIGVWDYHIVVCHRNHLTLMSRDVQLLNETGNLYDFTTAQTQAHGTNPMKELSPGVFGMVAGDGNSDGAVDEADREHYWQRQNGTSWEYPKLTDYNLDGGIDAVDLNLFWRPNNGSNSQVPGAAASSFISKNKAVNNPIR